MISTFVTINLQNFHRHQCKYSKQRLVLGATRPFPRAKGVEERHWPQQSDHAPKSGSEVKEGRSSFKYDALKKFRC